jgi:hypothetical protein
MLKLLFGACQALTTSFRRSILTKGELIKRRKRAVRRTFLFLGIVCVLEMLVLCSCASQTGFVKLGSGATPNFVICAPKDIQVFSAEKDVTVAYDKIGVVNYGCWQANTEVIMSWLKEEASKRGGNAIILKSVNPKGPFTYSYGTGEAQVIRLKPAEK